MAYNQLISNLKQYIRENGNEEITGQIMQDALIAIVKALSTYQQFGGMAEDVTEPDTENNVFYFALKGTYPQFGGLEVGDYEIGIFISYEDPEELDDEGNPVIKWKDVGIPVPPGPEGPAGRGVPDGGTTGQVLAKQSDEDGDTEWVEPGNITVDPYPTEDSTNPVQSGGMYDILNRIFPDSSLFGGFITSYSPGADDNRKYFLTKESGDLPNFELYDLPDNGKWKFIHWNPRDAAWDCESIDIYISDAIDYLFSLKADTVSGATAGNLAGLDSNGDLTDSGSKPSDFASASDVNDIKGKIPAQASSQNQLADKYFVNSSIATATATFKGTFNLVTDLSLSTSASQSDIATALAGAVSGEDNNDYAFVQIPKSDSTPTEISRVDRYKYNGTAWGYEFSLNNSSFTSSQWAAINSGITASLVNSFGNKYEKPSGGIPASDLASAVQTSLGKADTALQSYTESDPVFSASPAAGITSGDIADWDGKADHIPVVDASTIPASMDADKVYQYGTLSGDTTFPALNAPTDLTVAHVYCWTFTTPATAPTITWPSAITSWAGGSAPTINASKSYEVSVMDGVATIIEA